MKIEIIPPKVDILVSASSEINIGTPIAKEYVEPNIYDGEYVVTPSEYEQTLQTTNKLLTDNVVVKEVPFDLATFGQIDRLF